MQENNALLTNPPLLGQDVDVYCVPSSFIGSFFSYFKGWLEEKQSRLLIILEERLSLSSYADIAPQIKSYVLHHPIEETMKQIAWEHVFLKVSLWLPEEEVWPHKEMFESCLLGVHLVASGMEDFGAKVYANVRENILQQKDHTSLAFLKGSMKGVPAIICGAGPTLSQNLDALKQLPSSALILAGGAAIAALSARSVPFHAAAGIDPDPDYGRYKESGGFEVPFFYQDRFSSELLSNIQGEKVRLPANRGYPFEEWLNEALGREEALFDGGWTVATFLTSLATHLGCSPIVFVGMDFGFAEKMYAGEIQEDLKEKEHVIQKTKEIKTKNDWVMATEWLNGWIKDHPETLFINTSEVSSFAGAEKRPLEEVVEKDLQRSYDIRGLLHRSIEEAKVKLSYERALMSFKEYDESFARCEKILLSMLSLFEAYYPNDPTAKGEYILLEYDLYDELCYKVLLEPVWSIWKYVFARIENIAEDRRKIHELLFYQKVLKAHL